MEPALLIAPRPLDGGGPPQPLSELDCPAGAHHLELVSTAMIHPALLRPAKTGRDNTPLPGRADLGLPVPVR